MTITGDSRYGHQMSSGYCANKPQQKFLYTSDIRRMSRPYSHSVDKMRSRYHKWYDWLFVTGNTFEISCVVRDIAKGVL